MKDNRGMTLVEVVVAMALISIVLLSIYSFMGSGVKGFAREATTANNHAQVRRVSNNIGREVRRADSVTKDSDKLIIKYADQKKSEYRLEGNIIKVDYYNEDAGGNWVLDYTGDLASGIKTFNIDIVGEEIALEIESVENARGKTYRLETRLTIRR